MKALRFVAVLLVTAAGIATLTAPDTKAAIEKGTVLTQGSSPVPMCYPKACPDIPAAR
jgi:hypothetical protein